MLIKAFYLLILLLIYQAQAKSTLTRIQNLERSVNGFQITINDFERAITKIRIDLDDNIDKTASLRKIIEDLAEFKKIVGTNFSEIAERLNITETQLSDKRVKLENLKTETKSALDNAHMLLRLYRGELSHLNKTAKKLEATVADGFNDTKMQLEKKLNTIQQSTEAFSTKLNQQKKVISDLKEETDGKFKNVDKQLKAQKSLLGKHDDDINSLQKKTSGLGTRLTSAEESVAQLKVLRSDVDILKAAASANVAFSASITESRGVFTGPCATGTNNILKFNNIFTNVGNAYSSKTGRFTAPVKGVYHFSFMTFGYNSYTSGAILVKNGHYQVSTWEFKGADSSDTTSNTVILELDAKDSVNIILWRGGKIHTAVFSGFLLFPKS